MRSIRYQSIAEDLRRRLGTDEFASNGLLPSEADLSRSYEASRVTIRRALEVLRAEGLLESRQGYGWIIAAEPLRQDLSKLDTIERQLTGAGVISQRKILEFGYGDAPAAVLRALGCRNVLTVRRLNMADGEPFAVVTVWCPEALAASLSRSDLERASFLDQLPVEIGGATQTIGAGLADAELAELLAVPVDSPILVAERTTRSSTGRPVLMSEHVFPAHRTRFTVELS